MRAVLRLFVAVSWVAIVAGQASAQSNVTAGKVAGASAGSIVTAPDAAEGGDIRTMGAAGHTWTFRSLAGPIVMREGRQDAVFADDPVIDGIQWGALIGAGTGLSLVAVAYMTCDGCEAPAVGPMLLLGGGMGAGVGAVIGWLVDRAHSSRPASARSVSVAPILARRYKGVAVGVRF